MQHIEKKISNGFTNSLKAVIAAELMKQGVKKLFAPSTLPVTQENFEELKMQNHEIQIQNNTILNWMNKFLKQQDQANSFLN